MSKTRSPLEKRLTRLLATTPPLTQDSAARPKVDLVYLDPATQDRMDESLRE